MARAGDEPDAEPFEVVVRVVERVDLELAAVARAGVDLADRRAPGRGWRAARAGCARPRRAARRRVGRRRLGGDAGARDLPEDLPHQQVVPRVAEVERLVDQREVRNDVADHRMLEHRPVLPRRIVAVAAADARRRASSSSATRTSPRQPSTQPAPSAACAGRRSSRAHAARAAAPAQSARIRRSDSKSLVEAHRDARRDVAAAVRRHAHARARRRAARAGRSAGRSPGRWRGRRARSGRAARRAAA